MNKKITTYLIMLLLIFSLLLTTAAAPFYVNSSSSAASKKLMRLTIDNRDAKMIYLTLRSPDSFYWLRAPGDTITTFTVARDEYSYWLYGCGLVDTGTFDLTRNMKLINPVCGGNAKRANYNPGAIDLSNNLKLVRVYIINETGERSKIILTGPSTHVLFLDDNETGSYTLGRDTYKIKFHACGVWNTREFTPYKNYKLVLKCAN